jgi:hypothetical protein
MHAPRFSFEKQNRVVALLGFSRLGFMGACNQGRKVLEFLLWGRHCRHSFSFSRNNMKGAHFTIGEIQWVRNAKKGKFLIFRFWRCQGLRDEVLNVLRFLMKLRNV